MLAGWFVVLVALVSRSCVSRWFNFLHCSSPSFRHIRVSAVTCRVDNDCFLGHVCLNKMCIVGCRANSDCPESNTCINNRCTDPCRGDSCGPNANCQVSTKQINSLLLIVVFIFIFLQIVSNFFNLS